ncbi:MAG: M61 family metallopeptidase [Nitrososphaerota archaeon]|nr:M61 family metallopeptidase [Nitrososphaerota archaeon]MDG7023127.1 M61 family metallopeptidase [Nitrososphaerota archaeon]
MTEPITYTVSMMRANAHYMDVTMELKVPDTRGELRLAMPVWTPGHYLVSDFARNVDRVTAFDSATGGELKVQKLEKSLWRLETLGAERVRISYPVYAFAYSVSDSYIDDQHALINGASVFLYLDGMKDVPARLKLEPLPGWKAVSTGLVRTSEWEFEAPDYDVLVDSPVEVGNQEVERFRTADAEYEVSMSGAPLVDRKRFVEDIRKIVQTTEQVFGQVPYKRYVFLVNFTDAARGGLEHLNSTMCLLQRFRMVPAEEYHQAMGLFSHEFFHAWNVKRMRPLGLGPFDYSKEVYTKSLWIAEGVTSYYDDLILRRAGIYTVEEYLDAFSDNVNVLKSLPGSRHQSAEEASFDTWTKYYKPNENSPNVTSSYYNQGAVIGWMLDMVLRDVGRGTLDDVMKRVYSETFLQKGAGYADEEFERASVALGGAGAEEVFDSRVRGMEEVDFDRYLRYAGLRLEAKATPSETKGFLGVRLSSEGGRTLVKGCLAGSPAESMGLSVNDEVIGLNGLRVGQEKVSFYVGVAQPGEDVRLTVARNGRIAELRGRVGTRPPLEWRVQPLQGATERQKTLFKGWMLADWKAELKYPEYTRSPDRRAVLDYV